MNSIDISIIERDGIVRKHEPVTCGIPVEKGGLFQVDKLQIVDEYGISVPASFTPLAWWHDNSLKWVLADFQVDVEAGESKKFKLVEVESVDTPKGIHVSDKESEIFIDCGPCQFAVAKKGRLAVNSVFVHDVNILSSPVTAVLTDDKGKCWYPVIASSEVERSNALRLVIRFAGSFSDGSKFHTLKFEARYYFYANRGTLRVDFTVWNPEAAVHKKGVWDLGDEGSVLFKDLSLEMGLAGDCLCDYSLRPDGEMHKCDDDVCIYQDSSGGENWQSPAHINRNDEIPVSFRGYEIRSGGKILGRGERATPFVCLHGDNFNCTCTIPLFWQNFPKALEYSANSIHARLFPGQFGDLHELQGGEQKTHTIFLDFSDNSKPQDIKRLVAALHNPLIIHVDPWQYYRAGLAPRPVPWEAVRNDKFCKIYQDYITTAIHGDRSFFKRREIIDEYGWRNFGEFYADHEAVMDKGDRPFISHYNNQYDGIKGGLMQFMRTGDTQWYRLAHELARHVADIDIYRTDKDRFEYNKGLFWHTDHHVDAATATHRTTSIKHFAMKDPRFVGGGPSYEHNYSSGFCYCYWMTGENIFKECVLLFADYVTRGLEGPDTLLEYSRDIFKRIKTRIMSKGTTPFGSPYGLITGPGRGSGNALNTLVDAYLITNDATYLKKAAWLIRQCVGPDDDIEARDLLNAELRWMYLIFLQALGRFLEICVEREQWDADFQYARQTFVHYACWMLENEYPYLDKPEILEFPNETWAAQDIRKADILALAARYCESGMRDSFLKRSKFFFRKSLEYVLSFGENSFLTRPLVVVMTNGLTYMEIMHDVAAENIPDLSQNDVEIMSSKYNVKNSFLKILKNTSVKKEFRWLRNRLRSR